MELLKYNNKITPLKKLKSAKQRDLLQQIAFLSELNSIFDSKQTNLKTL